MRKILASLTGAALIASPAHAADWRDSPAAIQPGLFVGAKVRLAMGGNTAAKPRAALAIAPAQSRISGEGLVNTNIGEGLALNFGAGRKPTLTLAGVRADVALGLRRQGQADGDQKLGISNGGWVAIGVGAVLLVGAAAFYVATDCDESDSSDDCP